MQDLLARARAELRYEPFERRVRATAGAEAVVDSTRAVLVWEPRRVVPSYAVPAEDIRAELSAAPAGGGDGDVPGVLHPGVPFAVHTAAGEPVSVAGRAGAGFRLADEDLGGYVVLDFAAFDEWYEEDERIAGHPRDPFHRVDVRRSARPVRVELDGEVVAESTRARLLAETSLPLRFYLPREDVRVELRRGTRRSYCPYKGQASYWSADAAGRRRDDIAWSYEQPLPDAVAITGLVAFWDETVDVFLDGERRPRPGGAVADSLRDEFGVWPRCVARGRRDASRWRRWPRTGSIRRRWRTRSASSTPASTSCAATGGAPSRGPSRRTRSSNRTPGRSTRSGTSGSPTAPRTRPRRATGSCTATSAACTGWA
jgi:uncharacterized protein (DUF427 family)